MNPNLAIDLAQHELPGAPANLVMRKANEIFKANSTDWQTPFSQVDVEFATFMDYLKANCTQREIDLVYVSENLQRGWKILHLSLVMGEAITSREVEEVKQLSQALKRIGLLHLITDGLAQDLVIWVTQLSEAPAGAVTKAPR